jgi:hypothetical protein
MRVEPAAKRLTLRPSHRGEQALGAGWRGMERVMGVEYVGRRAVRWCRTNCVVLDRGRKVGVWQPEDGRAGPVTEYDNCRKDARHLRLCFNRGHAGHKGYERHRRMAEAAPHGGSAQRVATRRPSEGPFT